MIKLLDCTLRDGGYVNNWNFGYQNIKLITNNLTFAKIDFIECGFLENVNYKTEKTLFGDVSQIEKVIPDERGDSQYLALTRVGKFNIDQLSPNNGKSIDAIRIAFHVHEVEEGLHLCQQVKDKGYKVFLQPVGTTSFNDEQILSLIQKVNEIMPYAFYIVDTLGVMVGKDVKRMFYLVDHNLDPNINLGFHSHNNLQMSFSNAQEFMHLCTTRELLLDSSVAGLGRGAGNLNTELITHVININYGYKYNIEFLLNITEEFISTLDQNYKWGYSIPYFLAAKHNCHPNYSSYLINKKSIDMNSISKILNDIPHLKRELFHKNVIEKLYYEFQKHIIDDSRDKKALKNILDGKEILIIAPGKTIIHQQSHIYEYITNISPIIISVNFLPSQFHVNLIFFSNIQRFKKFIEGKKQKRDEPKLIVTSNIEQDKRYSDYVINYSEYLNEYSSVKDNVTLILLKFLRCFSPSKISLAGFDGFDIESQDQYYDDKMKTYLDKNIYRTMNLEIKEFIQQYSKDYHLNFITESYYKNKKKD